MDVGAGRQRIDEHVAADDRHPVRETPLRNGRRRDPVDRRLVEDGGAQVGLWAARTQA